MRSFLIISLLLYSFAGFSQVPAGYYDGTADLSGQELKIKLHQIIRNHQVRSYSEFRDVILPDLDEDPENENNIILFYKNVSIPKQNFASNNEADFWNREHTWPKSHGFPDDSDTAYTDVHNLRPSDATVNSSKSNKDFNDVENIEANAEGEAPDTYTNEDFWDPRDEIKGDVARILFYMATRYESSSLDLELVDRESFSNEPELGVLFTMIKWHEQDPVDDAERSRHEGAFGYQGNRNPFIDHPEWVSEIWGSTSDPYLQLDELNFNRDFGRVELGSALDQQYNLKAYNLVDDAIVEVDAPFFVSKNGQDWTDSIAFQVSENTEEEYTVYLRYEPEAEDEVISREVKHYTNGDTVAIEVSGNEGSIEIVSIAEAREFALGDVVTVTGVVIDAGNNSSANRVIYDGTAGIVVRSFDGGNESSNLVQGDSVIISGGLSEYNELLQIEESPITITLVESEVALPEPKIITIPEVGESVESQLIKVENVQFVETGSFAGGGADGNFTITDGDNELVFRIGSSSHPLVGESIPSGYFNITGFIGQFGSVYQLSPRTEDDLEATDGPSEPPLSIEDYKISEDLIYPNPTKGTFYFNLDNEGLNAIKELSIYSMEGVLQKRIKNVSERVDVSSLTSGLYMVLISSNDQKFVYKLIKN